MSTSCVVKQVEFDGVQKEAEGKVEEPVAGTTGTELEFALRFVERGC